MLVGLCVLVIFARGVNAQATSAEEFCSNGTAVYRGDHFEIVVNQTVYDYNRGIQVTVRPKPSGQFSQISDFFLYVPGTKKYPGQYGSNFVGQWYAMAPAAPTYCDVWWLASGVKSSAPYWPKNEFTVTWIAPMPRYYRHNNQYYSYPGDIERQRTHIYFAVYATPDPPLSTYAPAPNIRTQRKWYFAHSVKVENREIKLEKYRRKLYRKQQRQWMDILESMN